MNDLEQNLHRLSAFTSSPDGGNPAGAWLGEELPSVEEMQQLAAKLGYSETAFIAPTGGQRRRIRYFSPLAEVSFCGHATIASGVLLGQNSGAGRYLLETSVGEVPVAVALDGDHWRATLTSVATEHRAADADLVAEALAILGWSAQECDASIPPAVAYAGAWHLVIAAASAARLDALEYDFERLKTLMQRHCLTTLQLIWRESASRFHSRNPFPVGGVVEDAATGAAAAALGGYLRDAGLVAAPVRLELLQGYAMGRPSQLRVDVPLEGGIEVSGIAVNLPA